MFKWHDVKVEKIYSWRGLIYGVQKPCLSIFGGDEFKIYFDMRLRYNGRDNGSIVYSSRDGGEVIGKSFFTGARYIQ